VYTLEILCFVEARTDTSTV